MAGFLFALHGALKNASTEPRRGVDGNILRRGLTRAKVFELLGSISVGFFSLWKSLGNLRQSLIPVY